MKTATLVFHEGNCSGCHACEVACKQEHGLGVGPRLVRVLERTPFFKPLYCHHCEDAPCMIACPEGAIVQDSQSGVVLLDENRCTGCDAVAGQSGTEKQDTSPCKSECPAHINIQGYVSLAARGMFQQALALVKESNPFPSITGRVCHHPCESSCNRHQIDTPVAIHAIERYVGDLDLEAERRHMPLRKAQREEKIAIVGSGPAGLACAYYLALEGYQVTVFEKAPVLGGMLTMGIPAYRLPREIVEVEIQRIGDIGVIMKTGVEIGLDKTISQLRQEGFSAFFVAVGAQECIMLDIEGDYLEGIYPGLDYLRRINSGETVPLGTNVAVIGGGNVAVDAVRTARRLGAENAFIVYRRGLGEMPSRVEEIEECREEGIPIHTLIQPVRFAGENGRVKAIECVRTRLTGWDASGRQAPEPIPGSEFIIDVDAVIVALGQESDWACLTDECDCTLTDWGTMRIDPWTRQSDDPTIFAGGDATRGPQSVAEAIADGRQAAVSIDRYLRGLDLRLGRDIGSKTITDSPIGDFHPSARAQMPRLGPQERLGSFDQVQKGFTEAMVVQEAQRCISCGSCCVQACPYHVMQFNHEITKAVKCDLCIDRLERGEAPACTAVCPTRCIFWGDPETFPKGIEMVL